MKLRRNLKGLLLLGILIALVGCSSDSGTNTVTTVNGDESPPVVVSTMPANNSNDIAVNSAISMTFNEAIDTTSVSDASVVLSSSEGNVSGTISASINSITYTPQSDLSFDLLYTVILKNGTKDLAGNVLDVNHSWSFTTGDMPDTTAPTIVSIYPQDAADSVGLNDVIYVEFDEAIDPGSINSTTFILQDSTNNIMTTKSLFGNAVTLTPLVPLNQKTTYMMTVTTGVSDLAGNTLVADDSWSFTTEWIIDDTSPAPSVLLTYPQNGHTVSYLTSSISALFSEEMNASTITESTFTLKNNEGEVNGTVSYASGIATFNMLKNRLDILAPYTATITTFVEDSTGIRMANDYIWNFFTPDGNWKTAQLIENDNTGHAAMPQVVMDGNGNSVAVWYQWDGTNYSIFANRYDSINGSWGSPQLIESNNTFAGEPQVAADDNGNAVVVWPQSDGTRDNIWTNRYDSASGSWGTAQLIESDNAGDAQSPQVAMDGNGSAVVVWSQSDGTWNHIWANRYDSVNGSWGSAQLLESFLNTSNSLSPQVAVDGSGNAVAVWSNGTTRRDILSNRYDSVNGSWGGAQPIEYDNAGDALYPQVTVDGNGSAVAVWSYFDGTRWNIDSNRYDSINGSWGSSQLIESDDISDASRPQVAVDSSGNAVAVWSQSDGTQKNIWSNHYDSVSGNWGSAQLIESDNAGDAELPQVAVDGNGNAVAVWYQFDGTRYNIYSKRYNSISGSWGTAQLIESDNTGNAVSPQIAMDDNGNAMSVWFQFDGTRNNIWANRFE